MAAHPARVDHGHEALREVQYRERGLALHELRAALDGLAEDTAHFARVQHEQAHHDGHGGAWRSCERGACPGIRRALARAIEARARWQGVNDTDAE